MDAGVLGLTDIAQRSYDVSQRSDGLAGGMLWMQAFAGSSTRADGSANFELDPRLPVVEGFAKRDLSVEKTVVLLVVFIVLIITI